VPVTMAYKNASFLGIIARWHAVRAMTKSVGPGIATLICLFDGRFGMNLALHGCHVTT
jgi:hypothetical protein